MAYTAETVEPLTIGAHTWAAVGNVGHTFDAAAAAGSEIVEDNSLADY